MIDLSDDKYLNNLRSGVMKDSKKWTAKVKKYQLKQIHTILFESILNGTKHHHHNIIA